MKFFNLIWFFLFTSCARTPLYMSVGYKTIHNHIRHMEHYANWQGESVGGSFYGDNVKLLSASFIVPENFFNVQRTRELILMGINTFLTSINSNDKLVPHLNHIPFTYKDIKYGISIHTKEGKWLGHAFLLNGNLSFFVVSEWGKTEELLTEPYLEALERVK